MRKGDTLNIYYLKNLRKSMWPQEELFRKIMQNTLDIVKYRNKVSLAIFQE